ncbi:MAG: hypothetical protein HYZ17_09725 [Betaproteobacteria bacterium]|nr:hypothetical protein [Betaproteobacteria bacterium]
MTMDQEIWKVLPWVASGRLDEAERSRLRGEIESREQLRRGLDWETALRESVQAEASTWVAPPQMLAKVMARIGKESRPTRQPKNESWLSRFLGGSRWTPQLAMACGLVVVQFGVIGYLWSAHSEPDTFADYRTTQTEVALPTSFLRVGFQADLTERGMREILHGVGAEIVAGPSQLGDYYLLVDPDDIDRVAATLQSDQRVAAVERVDGLPGKL